MRARERIARQGKKKRREERTFLCFVPCPCSVVAPSEKKKSQAQPFFWADALTRFYAESISKCYTQATAPWLHHRIKRNTRYLYDGFEDSFFSVCVCIKILIHEIRVAILLSYFQNRSYEVVSNPHSSPKKVFIRLYAWIILTMFMCFFL